MEKSYAADENGIPWCSHDGCPQYNGDGECEISGDIMGTQCVCEPAITDLKAQMEAAVAEADKLCGTMAAINATVEDQIEWLESMKTDRSHSDETVSLRVLQKYIQSLDVNPPEVMRVKVDPLSHSYRLIHKDPFGGRVQHIYKIEVGCVEPDDEILVTKFPKAK